MRNYEEDMEMAEMTNKSFQTVFTGESAFFEGTDPEPNEPQLREIDVTVQEATTLMNFEVRKAQGPDGVSSWARVKCSEQLADTIRKLLVTFLVKRCVPLDCKGYSSYFKEWNKR